MSGALQELFCINPLSVKISALQKQAIRKMRSHARYFDFYT